jgi:hypothetical protein
LGLPSGEDLIAAVNEGRFVGSYSYTADFTYDSSGRFVTGTRNGVYVFAAGSVVLGSTAKHHVFPQEFRDTFEEIFKGSGSSIDDFTLRMPVKVHQRVHNDGWNAEWEEFLFDPDRKGLPSLDQTKAQAEKMMDDYGGLFEEYGPFIEY